MSRSKQYLLSFTTLFYDKKGYVLYFNRHRNVLNVDRFPQQFDPWNRFDALVLSDIKSGTKVKHATGKVSTVASDFSTVFDGSLSELRKGSLYYLTNLSESLNKGNLSALQGEEDKPEEIHDFYSKLGEVTEHLNRKIIRSITLPTTIGRTKVIEDGREISTIENDVLLGDMYGEYMEEEVMKILHLNGEENSTLELLRLLPQQGYNQVTEIADKLFQDAEVNATDRLMTIQYGERVVDMAKANYVKAMVDTILDIFRNGQVIEVSNYRTDEEFEAGRLLGMGFIGDLGGDSAKNISYADTFETEGGGKNLEVYQANVDVITDSVNVKKDNGFLYIYNGTHVYEGSSNDRILSSTSDQVVYEGLVDKVTLSDETQLVANIIEYVDTKVNVEGEGIKSYDYGSKGFYEGAYRHDLDSSEGSTEGSTEGEGDEGFATAGNFKEVIGVDGTSEAKVFLMSEGTEEYEESINYAHSEMVTDFGKAVVLYKSENPDKYVESLSTVTQYVVDVDTFEGTVLTTVGKEMPKEEQAVRYNFTQDISDIDEGRNITVYESDEITHTSLGTFLNKEGEISTLDVFDVSEGHVYDVELHWDGIANLDTEQEVYMDEVQYVDYVEDVLDVEVDSQDNAEVQERDYDITLEWTMTTGKVEETMDVEIEEKDGWAIKKPVVDVSLEPAERGYREEGIRDTHVGGLEVFDALELEYDTDIVKESVTELKDVLRDVGVEGISLGTLGEPIYDVSVDYVDGGDLTREVKETEIESPEVAETLQSMYGVEVDVQEYGYDGDTEYDVYIEITDKSTVEDSSADVQVEGMAKATMEESNKGVDLNNTDVAVSEMFDDVTVGGLDKGTVEEVRDVNIEGTEIANTDSIEDVTLEVIEQGNVEDTKDVRIESIDLADVDSTDDVTIETVESADVETISDVTVEGNDLASSDKTSDITLEVIEQAANDMTEEVVLEGHELAVNDVMNDVVLEDYDLADSRDLVDVVVETIEGGESESESEVTLEEPELVANENLVDVTIEGQDLADSVRTTEVELETTDMGDANNSFDVIVDMVEQADSDNTIDVVIEETELAEPSDTFSDVVIEEFDPATKGRTRWLDIIGEEESEPTGTGLLDILDEEESEPLGTGTLDIIEDEESDSSGETWIDIAEEEEVEKSGDTLIDIYEEEEVIKVGQTIMDIDEDDQSDKLSSKSFVIEEDEISDKFANRDFVIEEEDEGDRIKVLDGSMENEEEGDYIERIFTGGLEEEEEEGYRPDRVFETDIGDGDGGSGDDEGVGKPPVDPPWEEDTPSKGKVWLIMGKQYPAWNGWNPKKTR